MGTVLNETEGRTMIEMLRARVRTDPSATALEMADGSESVTYADLLQRAEKVSTGLQELGFGRGDSLALWLPNSIEWVVFEFAAARLGILVVPLNTRYKIGEVAHLLKVGNTSALIFMPDFHGIDFTGMAGEAISLAAEGGHSLRMVITLGGDVSANFADGLERHRFEDLERTPSDARREDTGKPGDLMNVFGTSGTTSFPKLASHAQMTIVRHAHNAAHAAVLSDREKTLGHLPFCGTFGFVALIATLAVGGCVVVLPVYTTSSALEAIAGRGVTYMATTEAIIRGILTSEDLEPESLATWERGIVGGTSVHELVEQAEKLGVLLTNVYGSSELFGLMAMWQPEESLEVRSTPGGRLVEDGMFVRAVDPQTGEPTSEGESGECSSMATTSRSAISLMMPPTPRPSPPMDGTGRTIAVWCSNRAALSVTSPGSPTRFAFADTS